MSQTSALLLRILLSMALVLNGPGAAMAAMQMPGMSGMQMHKASTVPAAAHLIAGADCHTARGAQATSTQVHGTAAPLHHAGATPSMPDCCNSGKCQCTCMQHCQVTATILIPLLPQVPQARALERMQFAHLPPALQRLNRPPIG